MSEVSSGIGALGDAWWTSLDLATDDTQPVATNTGVNVLQWSLTSSEAKGAVEISGSDNENFLQDLAGAYRATAGRE